MVMFERSIIPKMKKQRKGEPVKATFELFHKWAHDIGVIIKGEKPRLGTGKARNPYAPKNPRFKLKAVKGKRRRVLVQEDATVTGEYPPENWEWRDVLADESDNSDYYDRPWYWKLDDEIPLYCKQGDENAELLYFHHCTQDGLKHGYSILPIVKDYLDEGFLRLGPRTRTQWIRKHKLIVFAHILFAVLYLAPIIAYHHTDWRPEGVIETEKGSIWPVRDFRTPIPKGPVFHFWPPHRKRKVGWSKATLIGYGILFGGEFLMMAYKYLFCAPDPY
ncbi:hypothetical protein TWF281_006698 [Arthrobotrys megalospora]